MQRDSLASSTKHPAESTASDAAARQQRLLGVLACPHCRGKIALHEPTEVGGAVVDADIRCTDCGDVGVIRSYRPSFLADDLGDSWLPAGVAESPIDLPVPNGTYGDWSELSPGLIGISIGSCLTGSVIGPGIVVQLGTHSWGGAALVSSGEREQRIELYSPDRGVRRLVLHEPASTGRLRRWSIVVAPGAEPQRSGDQAIVEAIAELIAATDAPPLEWSPANNGNPYPARFAELLTTMGADAVIVDIGGGDRRHTDPRVFNFEYMKFRHADFFGDGLRLPIATGSVDLILSQAVLEHVPQPQRAVDELRRVLRPGGRIYAEFAFMQPLHAVPFHYFNITPHGAALLFDEWDVESTGTFGGLETTLSWFFRLLDAEAKIGADATASILGHLAKLDSRLSARELDYVASAVYVEATTPV